MLDADQMNKLSADALQGIPPSIPGEEAKAFYDDVKKDIDAMKAKGIMPMPIAD